MDQVLERGHNSATEREQGLRPPMPAWALIGLGVVISAVWAAAMWAATHLHADETLCVAARFVHVATLIIGFGSIITIDWLAILWLLGRRKLGDLLQAVHAVHVLVWLGLGGLVLSGLVLRPDLSSVLVQIKLGMVFLVTLNGLFAYSVGQRLGRCDDRRVPRRLLVQSGTTAAISQAGWWTATFLGFINSHT